MQARDRLHPGPRLRALEMFEERALGGRLAGTLYVTGAITATAMLLVPGVETRHWLSLADVCMRGAKATGEDRTLSARDFAFDPAAAA